ncbi:aminotransferase class I/II-fold pyridoxal phosphate-dependent enzyme [Kribbella albertanoniae]|uniref:Aminotransferase class V-fold PLP-dependent enzyme n=1 Tax=Kribbella albertanoniae TaxID=1266829 RepID=A0A4R4Q4W2_9ACTN|nr:aminotransferase class I/II-fold pyridoxal phosphate-dependent enzyme [Kribbella albertanoniae]TDC30181.1 aminotransferase class V-fold PLP-dependent enzyme [Kribbella albertanoniae]
MDQNRSPVLEALAEYHERGYANFAPPGHKQGLGADDAVRRVLGAEVFRSDVLATGALDDRKSGQKVLEQAQELMADAVGAEQAFFSTCGSSLSVKSAMMAVAAPGESMLIGRDAHKSVIAGLALTGIRPVWVRPRWDRELHLAHPPGPEAYEEAFRQNPDAVGALVTSPSPYGTCSDLKAIAAVCHRRGKPLVVDEAWGAHLPFHDELPTWAMDADADVCVVSIHKMGAGFEQGSVFHLQGDLVDPVRLKESADLLSTTSPNVLLYAAMDGWRRQMVLHGEELLGSALELARSTRAEIDGLPGLRVVEDELLEKEASHDLDRLQIMIDTLEAGISGYQAADWLRAERAINVGLSDHRRILAQLTFADDKTQTDRLVSALADLTRTSLPAPASVVLPDPRELELEQVVLPRKAFFAAQDVVPITESVGRIAAEQVTPYPPGIPAILPGERITAGVVDYLRSGVEAGMVIPDAADPAVQTLRVLHD